MKAEIRDLEKTKYLCEPSYNVHTGTLAWCEREYRDGKYQKELHGVKLPEQEILSYAWSPDGKKIAWVKAKEAEKEQVPPLWKAAIAAEGGAYRKDADGGWKIDRTYTLHVTDMEAGESVCLYESPASIGIPAWSADGKVLCFEDAKSGNCYHTIQTVDVEAAPVCLSKEIHASLGDSGCCFTADGKLVLAAGIHSEEKIVGYELFCLKADGSGEVSVKWQGEVPDEVLPLVINGSPFTEKNCQICQTGIKDTLAVIGSHKGRIAVYLLTVDLLAEENGEVLQGTWKRLTDGNGSYAAICQGEEGYLYGIRSDWNHPAQLVKLALEDGSWTVVVDENKWTEEKTLAEVTPYTCRSLDGAVDLDGWILKPAGEKEGKIPTVLLIHGGPLSAYADSFTMEAQLLAAAGFGVILVNPRGSSGYGAAYAAYELAFDGTAANDLLYYMDNALREFSWMDETRLGVAGGSYGGYMSAWLAGNCKRFKAAAVMRGLLNFEFLYLTSQAAGNPGMLEEPRDFQDFLMKVTEESPNFYAQDMDIPMLIMHGERDVNCPVDGAHQLYVAVKDTHPELPVRMVLFPETGHNIRAARLDYYQRYEEELVNWMKTYLV